MAFKKISGRFKPAMLVATALTMGVISAPLSFAQCCGGAASIGAVSMGSMPMGDMGGYYSSYAGQIIEGDSIYLTVNVPEKAILQINGDPTISQGPTRYFVVRGLEPGRVYSFEIVAETANPAGVAMEEKKSVKLQAGASETVNLRPVKRKGAKAPAKEEAKDDSKKDDTKEDAESVDAKEEPKEDSKEESKEEAKVPDPIVKAGRPVRMNELLQSKRLRTPVSR